MECVPNTPYYKPSNKANPILLRVQGEEDVAGGVGALTWCKKYMVPITWLSLHLHIINLIACDKI